jgi:hypothetical protein
VQKAIIAKIDDTSRESIIVFVFFWHFFAMLA